jgi:RHS repeat-associated protein
VSYTYNAQVNCTAGNRTIPHAVSGAGGSSYTYDCNGNQVTRTISGSTYNLAYDAENRMTSVSGATTASFVYDGDGKRVKGTSGGITTTYIGNYYEWTGSTSSMVRYYYDGTTRIAMRTGSNTFNWLFGDHLGSSSRAANSDGSPLANGEQRYKPWGEKRFPTGDSAIPTTFKFTGQRQDSYINLYWYGSRWYDNSLGRFTSPDTIIPEQSQGVQAWDRFAYSNNNPVRYTDPTGHMLDAGGGDCKDANVIVRTILLMQYNSREPLEPKDSLPGKGSSEPLVRAVEPASDLITPRYSGYNVATFLSYSIDRNGTVGDFEYSVWNNSDKSFFFSLCSSRHSRITNGSFVYKE